MCNRLAAEGGRRVPEDVVERDYCLAWFLASLAASPLAVGQDGRVYRKRTVGRKLHEERRTVRGGAYLRRRLAAFTAGLGLELVGTPSAPTYTRDTPGMGMPSVFEASRFSVVVGLAFAIDLGR